MTDNVLLKRRNGGLEVELSWLPKMRETVITARNGGEQFAVTVPHHRALDAYWHPALYLNQTQLERLFPRG